MASDWQGLAELCGISGDLIQSISNEQDPTAKILKLWNDQSKVDATVDKLIIHLEELDRSDIVDEILPLIAEDLKLHKEQPLNGKTVKPFDQEADTHILTQDDVSRINQGLAPQLYDAFVLFAEDDIDFATELIDIMEKDYNLKFCVKERDLLGGSFEHDAVIQLITERCGKLIVILSPAFLQSNANTFFYSLAQKISIEQQCRKIIPCIYKDCGKLPPTLDCYFKLDFRRSGAFWNFWKKLSDTIKMPEKPRAKLSLPENRSVSTSEQHLSPEGLKSSLHKDTGFPRDISQSVKFSSMSSLPNTDVPADNMEPSTSANSLSRYEDKTVRKTFSFLKKIKSLVPKSKSEKNRSTDQQQTNKSDEKNNKENTTEKIEEKNATSENHHSEKDIKQEKKDKKQKFTLKRNKKKAVLADI